MSAARMIVVFRLPPDREAFDRHYFDVHVPLAKQLPGLRKYEVSVGSIGVMNGARESQLIATLHFDNVASIRAAFASEIGQACAADRKRLCHDADVQTFLFDIRDA
jgi:uncharacterized protein (TIGR02118 family)